MGSLQKKCTFFFDEAIFYPVMAIFLSKNNSKMRECYNQYFGAIWDAPSCCTATDCLVCTLGTQKKNTIVSRNAYNSLYKERELLTFSYSQPKYLMISSILHTIRNYPVSNTVPQFISPWHKVSNCPCSQHFQLACLALLANHPLFKPSEFIKPVSVCNMV